MIWAIAGCIIFGLSALWVILACVISSVAFEALFNVATKRTQTINLFAVFRFRKNPNRSDNFPAGPDGLIS